MLAVFTGESFSAQPICVGYDGRNAVNLNKTCSQVISKPEINEKKKPYKHTHTFALARCQTLVTWIYPGERNSEELLEK